MLAVIHLSAASFWLPAWLTLQHGISIFLQNVELLRVLDYMLLHPQDSNLLVIIIFKFTVL
jgi:hypothetical protein